MAKRFMSYRIYSLTQAESQEVILIGFKIEREKSGQVYAKLQKRMINAYLDVVKTSMIYELPLRDAAFVNAISKALDVMERRSVFPQDLFPVVQVDNQCTIFSVF